MTTAYHDLSEAERNTALSALLLQVRSCTGAEKVPAIRALEPCGADAMEPLCVLLTDVDLTVKSAAAEALFAVGDGRAVNPLGRALMKNGAEDVGRFLWMLTILTPLATGAAIWLAVARQLDVLGWIALLPSGVLLAWWTASAVTRNAARERFLVSGCEALATASERSSSLIMDFSAAELEKVAADLFQKQSIRKAARRAGERLRTTAARLAGSLVGKSTVSSVGLGPDEIATAIQREVDMLQSVGRAERAQAACNLGQLGPGAREPLIGVLRDRHPLVRAVAAGSLGQLDDPRAQDALCEALRDGDVGVRAAAAHSLGLMGDERAAAALSRALRAVFARGSARVQRIAGQVTACTLLVTLTGLMFSPVIWGHEGGWGFLGAILLATGFNHLMAQRLDQGPFIQAASVALTRIAERAATPQLVGLARDLREVSRDAFQQNRSTRRLSLEAAERIEAAVSGLKDLPVATSAPELAGKALPVPASVETEPIPVTRR